MSTTEQNEHDTIPISTEPKLDYIRIVNQLMGIIFAKPYYDILIENVGDYIYNYNISTCKQTTRKYIHDFVNTNYNTTTGNSSVANGNFADDSNGNYARNILELENLIKTLIKVWIPNNRDIPETEYYILADELYTLVSGYIKNM
jgi:hypothetical protein